MLKKLCVVVAFLLLATSAQASDWLWEDEMKIFAPGEVLTALPEPLQSYATEQTGTLYGEWQYATAPADLNVWISAHCARFIEQMGLGAVTDVGTCVTTTFLVNKKDPGLVLAGDRWLLPSLENDPAELQANFAAAAAAATAAAELAKPLTRGEAQAMLREVVVTLTVDDGVKDFLIAEVGRQIDARGPAATVSSEMVQNALTAYMLEHGDELGVESLPTDLTSRFDAITGRLDGIEGRVTNLETTKADATSVTAVGDRVTTVEGQVAALEKGGVSQTGLWLAGSALTLAALALIYSLFGTVSKKALTAQAKTTGDQITVVSNVATAAKDAADKANVTAAAAQSAVAAVDAKADLAHTTAMQAHALATHNFDSIHGLMPQQFFPAQAELDALTADGSINLVFEADRKQYTITIMRDVKGLKVEGLTGRARVAVTDHKSVLNTIVRAFAKAKTEKGSAIHAFAVVKAVKAAAAA